MVLRKQYKNIKIIFQAKGGKSSFGPSQNKKDDFSVGGFSLDVSFFGYS